MRHHCYDTNYNSLLEFPALKHLEEYLRWMTWDFDGDYREHEPFPHLRIRITDTINGDDRLLRGELLGIMRTMTGRFRQKTFANHCVIPVSLSSKYSTNTVANFLELLACSFMAPQQARILVSYIEGDDLVVGYSKLYDFRTRDDCSLYLFTRWWMLCTAYGITRENGKVLRSNS